MNMIARSKSDGRGNAPAGPIGCRSLPAVRRSRSSSRSSLALIAGARDARHCAARPSPAAPPPPTVTVATPLVRAGRRMGRLFGPVRSQPERRGAPARLGRRSSACTSPTARSSSRANCSSPSIRGRSPRRWPKRAPRVASARSDLALAADRSRPRHAAARRRCRVARATSTGCAPASRRRRRRSPPPTPAFSRARSTSSSPRSARRSAAEFPTAGSIRQSRPGRRRRRRHAADDDQRARSDLLHLRRVGSPVPQGAARARQPARRRRRSRSGCRTRPTIAGTARLDFTDNGLDTRSGTIRAARRASPTRAVPDARHVRQHAPVDRRHAHRRCWCPIPRSRPTRRARSCWSSARTATSRRSRSTLGPVIDGLRVIRSGLAPTDAWSSAARSSAMPGRQGADPRRQDRRPDAAAAAPDSVPRSAQRRSDLRRPLSSRLPLNRPPRPGRQLMRLSRFFITRPIFAAVIAILITVVGAIAYFGLPVVAISRTSSRRP